MKKRLLSLLLILCLCAALLPAMVLAEDNVTIVTTEEKLKEAIKKGGSVQLGEKITLNATLEINNNTVILDLNGKVLEAGSPTFGAIRVTGSNASLTLTDNRKEKNGKISGFSLDGVGGGVYVDGGSFIMNGGTIDSCVGMGGGGGVYLTNDASFTMNAGTIIGCRAQSNASGGGVYVNSDCTFMMEGGAIDSCCSVGKAGGGVYAAGTFIMSGGEIRSCHTEDGTPADGGGVYVASSGMFEMSGGSIEGCCAWINGGGVYVNTNGTFKMSGGTIRNNRLNKS